MAVTPQTFAQTVISLTATVASPYSQTDYEAATWTVLGGVTNTGGRGDTVNETKYSPFDSDRELGVKGTVMGGGETYTFVNDITDAGQLLAKAGLAAKVNYFIKEVWQDGTVEYFPANILGLAGTGGDVNAIRSSSMTISVNGATVLVAA